MLSSSAALILAGGIGNYTTRNDLIASGITSNMIPWHAHPLRS